MFDLLQRDAVGTGVPVPLPGRVVLFAGKDGAILARLPDGSVVSVAGGAGAAAVAATHTRANKGVLSGAVGPWWVQSATGGQSSEPWRMQFAAAGVQSNGTTASTMTMGVYVANQLKGSVSVALGTTAKTDRPWWCDLDVQADGADAVARVRLLVHGVTAAEGVVYMPGVADWSDVSVQAGFAAAVAGSSLRVVSGCARAYKGVVPQ